MSDSHKSLTQLREERGLSVEALAATIKVAPSKLQALEAGRYEGLGNAAFVRALAMSVCRVLKVDPAPILATLPRPDTTQLLAEPVPQEPFRSGQPRLNLDSSLLRPLLQLAKPKFLAPALILLAASLVYFWPEQAPEAVATPESQEPLPAEVLASAPEEAPAALAALPEPAASDEVLSEAEAASDATQEAASAVVQDVPAQPAPAEAASATTGAAPIVVLANGDTWVQIKDAEGAFLLRRVMLAGERVALTGVGPLQVKIGNAAVVELSHKGRKVDLTEHTRANVARLELP